VFAVAGSSFKFVIISNVEFSGVRFAMYMLRHSPCWNNTRLDVRQLLAPMMGRTQAAVHSGWGVLTVHIQLYLRDSNHVLSEAYIGLGDNGQCIRFQYDESAAPPISNTSQVYAVMYPAARCF
jgi:hypothetical protein